MSIGKIGLNANRRVQRNTNRRFARSTDSDPCCPTCESCLYVRPDPGTVTLNGYTFPSYYEMVVSGVTQCTGCRTSTLRSGESHPADRRYLSAASPNNTNKLYLLVYRSLVDVGGGFLNAYYHCIDPGSSLYGHQRYSDSGCTSPIGSDVYLAGGVVFGVRADNNNIFSALGGVGLNLNTDAVESHPSQALYLRWAALYASKSFGNPFGDGVAWTPSNFDDTVTDTVATSGACTGARIGYGGSARITSPLVCVGAATGLASTYTASTSDFASAGSCAGAATPGWDGVLTNSGSNLWTSSGGTSDGQTLNARLEYVGSGGVCWQLEIYCGASPGTGTIWKGSRAGGRYPVGPLTRDSGTDTTPTIWIE